MSQIIFNIGGYGHMQTHNLTMKNQPQVLHVCFKSLATWGQIDTWKHISHNKQPVSEFIGVHQTIGHIGAHGNMQTHECTMYNEY